MIKIIQEKKCEIGFFVLSVINLYILPIICMFSMQGDKTDRLMTIGLVFVPLGWILCSFVYGIVTNKVCFSLLCPVVICLPLVFVNVITGQTIQNKISVMGIIISFCLISSFVGLVLGRLVRRAALRIGKK